MIMNKKILPAVILLSCGRCLSAQEPAATLTDWSSYRLMDAVQTLRRTHNAAALSVDTFATRGFAQFGFVHSADGFHRVQEGTGGNALHFQTERYQSIGQKLVAYGRFDFDYGHVRNRAWCDVRNAYDGNPYFAGSRGAGSYDNMDFSLTAALGTVEFSGWRFGGQLDYGVGDLSRLRDPRSRSEMLDYRIAPSVSYSVGRQTIGIDAHYRRRKEKIPNMTTVQQDPNLVYYQFYGLGEAVGTVGGYSGFQREWVNHEFGAELSYETNGTNETNGSNETNGTNEANGTNETNETNGTNKKKWESLSTISIARGAEDAWGQYKFSPGHYTSYIYKAASRHRFSRGRLLHSLDLEAQWQQAYADEYRQQLIQEKDPDRGYTSYRYDTQITYRKRQQLTTVDASLHYRLNILAQTAALSQQGAANTATPAVVGYLGLQAAFSGSDTKHLLPSSELDHQRLNFTLEGGYGLLRNRLWLDATVTYSHATKARLNLADNTTEIARQVLLPDMAYYDADYFRGQLSAKYLFPLTLKGHRSLFYVKAYGDIVSARHAQNRNAIGLSLGLYN